MTIACAERNFGVIRKVARARWLIAQRQYQYKLPYESDDFVQIGCEAIIKKPDLPTDLDVQESTLIGNVVEWALHDEVRRILGRLGNRQRNQLAIGTTSLDQPIEGGTALHEVLADDEMSDPARAYDVPLTDEVVENIIGQLNFAGFHAHCRDRNRDILRMRYEGLNQVEIGARVGLTHARVSQILHTIGVTCGEQATKLIDEAHR